ncbi:major facilitator superfamily domain-containing protein 6-like isoform X1 [Clavelina lepadiformis]|uniref:major facilitator superfamily domain-containing protein 6-like isoform X1 n=1 Tax=Clavelina lepadiformis TaxID=159417 RepID=UPI004041AEA2
MGETYGERESSGIGSNNLKQCFSINTAYLPLKVLYFLYLAGEASFLVFLSVFMRHLGLSTQQSGILFAVHRSLGIIASPVFGAISDKTGRPKTVLIALLLAASFTSLSLLSVPVQSYQRVVESVRLETHNTKEMKYNITTENMKNLTIEVKQTEQYDITFWVSLSLLTVAAFFYTSPISIIEATTYKILGAKDKHNYGLQRLWGSIGFGIASVLSGYLKDFFTSFSDATTSNIQFIPSFGGAWLFWILSAVVVSKLPVANCLSEPILLRNIKGVITSQKFVSFLTLVAFFYGYALSLSYSYGYWLAEEKLNASSATLGIASLCGSLVDIPFFLGSGFLIQKCGHLSLLLFCQIIFAIRLYFLSIITKAWQFIILEAMRGINWGLMWPVACSYTVCISPKKLEATTMGIMYATTHGLGYSFGSLFGGYLFKEFGSEQMFFISFVLVLSSSVLYLLITLLVRVFFQKDTLSNVQVDENEELKKLSKSGNHKLGPVEHRAHRADEDDKIQQQQNFITHETRAL